MAKTYAMNIKKTLASTASDSVFVDVKPDSSVRMRLLPSTKEDGSLWYLTANHFGIVDEEGKTRAPACGAVHGDGTCFYCDLANYLSNSTDKGEQQLGNDLSANKNWYAQVLIATKNGDDWEYSAPKLVRMTKTTADKVNKIIAQQYEYGDDFLNDIDNGQDVSLQRTGSQKATRYEVMPVGKKSALADIRPNWESELLDVLNHLKSNPPSVKDAIAGAVRTYGERLDWDEINQALGE